MIRFRPFRGWRPVPHLAHLVGSRSFLSYTDEQIRSKLAGNPFTFLHVVHPEHSPGAKAAAKQEKSRTERFKDVRHMWNAFVAEGWFVRDEKPCFYLYEQSRPGLLSRGIIGVVSVGDYRGGRVKVHEHTLASREELFKENLDVTGINAEPVLLAAPGTHELDTDVEAMHQVPPTYDFSTTDRIRHRLWAVSAPKDVATIAKHVASAGVLYIADGHHRLASSARLAEATGAYADAPKAWCLAFIVPQEHLHIHNFDRALTSLGGIDTDELIEALGGIGPLKPLAAAPDRHPAHGHVCVCTRKGWFDLELPPAPANASPADRLDASVLSDAVLKPVLGVQDLRTDPHVRFVPGTAGVGELERMVRSGEAKVAFHLCPVSFAELQAVADSGGCMPPKSTWIEPKLRSGLTVYGLED